MNKIVSKLRKTFIQENNVEFHVSRHSETLFSTKKQKNVDKMTKKKTFK